MQHCSAKGCEQEATMAYRGSKAGYCSAECRRLTRNRYQQARYQRFRSYMAPLYAAPCVDCGAKGKRISLVHTRGTALFSVSQGWLRSREILDAEIAKCDPVCPSCRGKRRWHKEAG